MEQCPFCTYQRVGQIGLDEHVLKQHLGTLVAYGRLDGWHDTIRRRDLYTCWCGVGYLTGGGMSDHWQKAGGVTAHILEITLGGQS